MKTILLSLLFISLNSCTKGTFTESVQFFSHPVANGSIIENYPNVGGTGANWTNLQGDPNCMYYVYQTANTCLDLYLPDPSNGIPSGATINSVTVTYYGNTNSNKGVSSNGSVKLALKENGTTTLGTQQTLSMGGCSWFSVSQTWTVRPSDGQPFTKTDIDNIEFGFSQTRPGGVGFTKAHELTITVDYN